MIRERKDGGYSWCSASEEHVGKKRCCHVAGTAYKMSKLRVDIQGIQEDEEYVKSFFGRLKSALPQSKKQLILGDIRQMLGV